MSENKKLPKKTIDKGSFNLNDFKKKNGMDTTVKMKELTWIPLSDSFFEALKIFSANPRYMILSLSEKGHQAGTSPDVPMPPRQPVASINRVFAPSRADAIAEVHPDGPPPTTMTS